jgi:diacylglycerol kinase family enzyme
VLLNAAAVGAGKPHSVADIAELFLAAGSRARITMLERGQDFADAARTVAARAPIVVAGGSDGTVSGVAAGLIGTSAVLGILPIGTSTISRRISTSRSMSRMRWARSRRGG